MRWAGSARKAARRHRVENPGLALHPEVAGDPAPLRDEADEGFGLVGVAPVGDEEPGGLGVGVDGPGDVRGDVRFRPGRPRRRGDDRAGRHVAVGDEAEGAVADVLVLAARGAAGARGLGRGGALQRVDAGHLVAADDVAAQRLQHRRVGVGGADRLHLGGEGDGTLSSGLGVAPVAAAVGPKFGLH
jgi:hypothetical protein